MTIRVYFRCHEQCLISINFRKSPGILFAHQRGCDCIMWRRV